MVNKFGKANKGRGKNPRTHKHKNTIPVIVNEVVEKADIILEVLDARFIEKTRHFSIEKAVKKMGKILIVILNKSDLVDVKKVVKDFELEELRPYVFFSSKSRRGSRNLKKLIKIEAKKLNKEDINIGVIGYPNTGKSSLINYMTGRSSAKTSSEAGYTKGIQKIKFSSGLYLIDTPGIIPPLEKSGFNQRFLLKHPQIGAISWDKAKNPDLILSGLMKEYPGVFEEFYKLDVKGDFELFIEKLGRKLNYLKKGNQVDENRVSKKVLKDWQEGKI